MPTKETGAAEIEEGNTDIAMWTGKPKPFAAEIARRAIEPNGLLYVLPGLIAVSVLKPHD
jgi:hypothetical protein